MSYEMKTAHPFYEVTRSIVEGEIRSGNTVSLINEVDLTGIEELRGQFVRAGQSKPSYTAFVVKAVALALREFPYANRRIVKGWLPFSGVSIQQFTSCDMTVAVEREFPDVEVATFIDVLRNADGMPIQEVSQALRVLATCDESNNQQWRDYKSLICRFPAWISKLMVGLPVHFPRLWARYRGGAALVSSPAKYGVDTLIGSWTAPVGVSFGFVKERAVVKNGRVVPCPTFNLLVNFDRRVMAGAQAARFFKCIVDRLEDAASLLSVKETKDVANVHFVPGGCFAGGDIGLLRTQGVAMMST